VEGERRGRLLFETNMRKIFLKTREGVIKRGRLC
jgi:hypothetical protein